MGILTNLSLFSGGGGLDAGARFVGGIKTVCYVEWNRWAQGCLMSRMRDGGLDEAPIWDDVTTFDGKPWRGLVDIVSGGFPCQPHSNSGKRLGKDDERNLWPEYLRIVRECRPSFVLGENVEGIFSTGFALEVMADLEKIGYCVVPTHVLACEVGGPFPRGRVFFIAHSISLGLPSMGKVKEECPPRVYSEMYKQGFAGSVHLFSNLARDVSNPSSGVVRNDDGLSEGVERLRLCGNGVAKYQGVPAWQRIKRLSGV